MGTGNIGVTYGYARVSTKGQASYGNSLEDQIQILKENGCQKIIAEQYTGTKTDRPKFNELLGQLQSGDTLTITKLDRFARNASHGIEIIQSLTARGISVNILNMGKADDTPMGKLMITILLAFAEFERDMILERTAAGKAIAKTKAGYKEGRPEKYNAQQKQLAINLLLQGNSYTQVSDMTGISKSTLTRAMRQYKANNMIKS